MTSCWLKVLELLLLGTHILVGPLHDVEATDDDEEDGGGCEESRIWDPGE